MAAFHGGDVLCVAAGTTGMSVIADLIRAGVDPELVQRVHEEMLDCARSAPPERTARQERNARYYEKRRLKASYSDDSDAKKGSSPFPLGPPPQTPPPIIPQTPPPKKARDSALQWQITPLEILKSVLSDRTAEDVIAHRKAKRAPLTPRAAELLAAAFRDHGNPEAAAAAMIVNGWQGFKPEWMNGHQPRAGPAGRSNGVRGFLENVAAMMADGTDTRTENGNGSSHQAVLSLPQRRG